MYDIASAWKRIERWVDENAPELATDFLPPAVPAAIARAEATLGVKFPDEYRASLLCHAGEEDNAVGVLGHSYALLSLSDALSLRAMLLSFKTDGVLPANIDDDVRPSPGVRKSWFHEGWIPVASNGSRDVVCLDLAPAEGGSVGQLVRYVGDMDTRKLLAPSFGAWLTQRADDMEAGRVFAKRNDSTGKLIGLRYVGDVDDD